MTFRNFWQWIEHWLNRHDADEERRIDREIDQAIGPTGDEDPLDDRPFDPSKWYEPPKGGGQ